MKTIIIIRRQAEDHHIKDRPEWEDRQDREITITEDQIMEDRIIITDTKNKKLFQEIKMKQFFYMVKYNKKCRKK
jgi:hypothetical protein